MHSVIRFVEKRDSFLIVDQRLPSESELCEQFQVSRPTVREALKRLAAQNLIRSERGSSGGAFVNRMTWGEAQDNLVTTTRLLISMNDIAFEDAIVQTAPQSVINADPNGPAVIRSPAGTI